MSNPTEPIMATHAIPITLNIILTINQKTYNTLQGFQNNNFFLTHINGYFSYFTT